MEHVIEMFLKRKANHKSFKKLRECNREHRSDVFVCALSSCPPPAIRQGRGRKMTHWGCLVWGIWVVGTWGSGTPASSSLPSCMLRGVTLLGVLGGVWGDGSPAGFLFASQSLGRGESLKKRILWLSSTLGGTWRRRRWWFMDWFSVLGSKWTLNSFGHQLNQLLR